MGNQQTAGVQFCSRGQMYTERSQMTNYKSDTHRSQMTSYKSDPETRVGYNVSTKPRFQVQRIQKAHQQIAPHQQQNQEDIVEIPLYGPGKWQIPKSIFEVQQEEAEVTVQPKPSFSVYISCLDKEEETLYQPKVKPDVEVEIVDHFKDDFTVYEGVFGNVIVNKNGLVLYTDIVGKKHCEEYDRVTIGKIFPMGISFGGLTKSIWFKDGVARDEAFDMMISLPPSYNAVKANPTMYDLVVEDGEPEVADDDENIKIFEGIKETNVIVHADNIVLYTDINANKHCIHYNKHNITKCFPNGIRDGGLPRAIWLKDEMERDLCFMLMQWNMEEECDEIPEESPEQKFTGIYGGVVLHADSQIEYTSLIGHRVKCFYEPSEIQKTFPQGISHGRLLKTIWFRDIDEREKCIEAMRKM